jgi:hypothetical protein
MATISQINLSNLMIQCTQNIRGFGAKYDYERKNIYFKLDKEKIVNFLADNFTNVEYDTQRLSKIINITDDQILEDLKQVLISSLIVNFNGGYTNDGYMRKNIQIDYEVEKTRLKQILYEQLQSLMFKRTSIISRPYGFM